ncbi:MAG: hypothetical protein OEY36_03735 [Gammaproteobacteria bacterium]|nr:hypothetical protein [Gammaproteobacteria bacterium]
MINSIKTAYATLLILISISAAQANAFDNLNLDAYNGQTYMEGVAETDGTASLTGVHFVTYAGNSQSQIKPYFGGGLVYVTLPDQDDTFLALHAIAGTDFKLSSFLALNFEAGIDFGEELISDDENGTPINDNQVDYSFAAGVKIDFSSSFYLKGYVRYHAFDGVFLPPTDVVFAGVRAGISF